MHRRLLTMCAGTGTLVASLLGLPVSGTAAPAPVAAGVTATPAVLAPDHAAASLRGGRRSKGGYKSCPRGSRIRVHAVFGAPTLSDARITVRIYASPSRPTRRDRRKVFPTSDYSDPWVVGGIRSGYWRVRSSYGPYVVGPRTYARCVVKVRAGAPRTKGAVGDRTCAQGQELTFVSNARGTVRHQWLAGPPHLGYRWRGGVVARSRALQFDQTYTNKRSVYGARVAAGGYKGASGRTDGAWIDCRRR